MWVVLFFCVCAGHREYHVQFFGSVAERAWIHEKRIVIYQGKQQFEELQAETLRKATNPVEKQKVRTSRNMLQHLFFRLLKRKNSCKTTWFTLQESYNLKEDLGSSKN